MSVNTRLDGGCMENMKEIAASLTKGINADIWCDSMKIKDKSTAKIIKETQAAMTKAACILANMTGTGSFTVVGQLAGRDEIETFEYQTKSAKDAERLFVKDLANNYGYTPAYIKVRGYEVFAIFAGHQERVTTRQNSSSR
jgi:hypothetical protein